MADERRQNGSMNGTLDKAEFQRPTIEEMGELTARKADVYTTDRLGFLREECVRGNVGRL